MAHLLKQVEGLAKGEGVSASPHPFALLFTSRMFVLWVLFGVLMETGVLGLLTRGAVVVLYYAHHLGGPGFRRKRTVQQKCTILFCFFLGEVAGTSAVDSVSLLLPPLPSHPSGRMHLQAVNTAELSKTRATALVLEAGGGKKQ